MFAQHPGAVGFPLFHKKLHHRLQGFDEQAVAVQASVELAGFQDIEDAVDVHDVDPVGR